MIEIPFENLNSADLVVDTIYKGGNLKGKASEVLSRLLPNCSNSGGFRKVMRKDNSGLPAYVVLYTSMNELAWPDYLDEETGVSKSMLAQIEKGTANPSLGVLGKITSGLRIEFQELIDAPPMESCLVTPDQMTPTKEMIGEYKVWTCFPYEDNHQLEIYRIDIEPGGKYISGSHGEKTREYLSVTDGELTIECGEDVQKITKGEIYRFETDKKHNYKNETQQKTSFICVFVDYR